MAYGLIVVFIETPAFAADREAHLSDDEFASIQQKLADRPDAGDLIPGGHGLRKARIALKGRGKSGGGRVIYFWRMAESQILLVAMFSKNVKVDLTKGQLAALARAYTGNE